MSARVLIADDDRAIRSSLARALGLEGYEVLEAATGHGVDVIESAHRTSRSST